MPTSLEPFDAVIFDMDGTLSDNMPMHLQAFSLFMERYGLPEPSPEVGASLIGRRNSEILPVLFNREIPSAELIRYVEEKEAIYYTLIQQITPLPGLLKLLDRFAARKIPAGLATSAPGVNVDIQIQLLGLQGRFAALALGEDMKRGKPAPDIFLAAAQRLGHTPERCLAFEDAYNGVASAKAAGMRVVALATTHTAEELRANTQADFIVRDYEEFLEQFVF